MGMGETVAVNGRGGRWLRLCKTRQRALQKKVRVRAGSAGVVQGAELFDQHFAGDQLQLEIKRALHEDLDGCLRGHGILLPWEWLARHPRCQLLISSEVLWKNLIERKERAGISAKGKSGFCFGCILTH